MTIVLILLYFFCCLQLCFHINVDYCTFLNTDSVFALSLSFSVKKRVSDFTSKETGTPRWIVYLKFCSFPSFTPSQFWSDSSSRLSMNLPQPRHQDAVGLCWPVHLSPVSAVLDVSSLQVGHLPKQNCDNTLSWGSSRGDSHSLATTEQSAPPLLTSSSIPLAKAGSNTGSLSAVTIRAGSSTCHTVWG